MEHTSPARGARRQPSSAAAAVVATALTAGAGATPIGSPDSAAAPSPAARELHALLEEHDQWQRKESPELAMSRGDYRYADRVFDESIAAIERRRAEADAFLRRVQAIDRSQLDEEDLVTAELFERTLVEGAAEHRFRTFLAPFSSRHGPHTRIAQMHERVRFATTEDYENFLTRLELVPAQLDHVTERLRLGLAEGRTPPRVTLLELPEQLDALLGPEGDGARGGLQALAAPFSSMPAHVDQATATALRERFERRSLPAVAEALRRLRRFLAESYLPGAREEIAATAWPDGAAYYQHCLRRHTTTDLTAQEIHAIGLSEVARIRAEMLQVIRRTDFLESRPECAALDDDALFAAFLEHLRTHPRFYHEREESLLAGYRDICKRVDGWLPRMFGTLPRLPYGVRPIPRFMAAGQTTAYYQAGDLRNGEAGWFYANTFRLDMRPRYEMVALALHEAVPGHHLQIALAKELDGLPEFRREASVNAFVEGWALYAERLGIENGMYEDPYDDFGRLLYEMWRACRLVVDPGMHALGWTREQAIEYLRANTALSELNIVNEVDRYIGWPGQACGYKIGERRIRALRALAEERLGPNFDIRAFHDALLGGGALPLEILDRRMRRWIEARAGAAALTGGG